MVSWPPAISATMATSRSSTTRSDPGTICTRLDAEILLLDAAVPQHRVRHRRSQIHVFKGLPPQPVISDGDSFYSRSGYYRMTTPAREQLSRVLAVA